MEPQADAPQEICQRCGQTLNPHECGGLCPRCLLGMVLHTHQNEDSEPMAADPGGAPLSTDHQFPHIEGYVCRRALGTGGMGIVYEAEQLHPIKRTVAIKLIKLGMDTQELIARFEHERQVLALLNHPNVAAVYDAGATETGRPFFVMEYVPGEPITGFCDRHHYSIRQRLELFLQACEGVHHAHQKALIHRDLKPTNLLVCLNEERPLVKVIDFGMAKAAAQSSDVRTLLTEHGQMIGTPAYMSPEQAQSNCDIDTRTDIYSLGVVLYELLSGTLPVDIDVFHKASVAEIWRVICETDAPRPSEKLLRLPQAHEIALRRQTQPLTLERELRQELEWIPLKAMRKERAERYETAAELMEDIRSYLAGRPLSAAPESTTYRVRKLFQRNRKTVSAITAIVLVLLLGTTISTWQWWRAYKLTGAVRIEQAHTLTQRNRAQALFQQSERSRGKLEDALYRNQIQLAYRLVLEGRVAEAEHELKNCQETKRGWEWNYINRLCHSEQLDLFEDAQSRGPVDLERLERRVVFSADGAMIASLSGGAPLQIWESRNGNRLTPPALPTLALGSLSHSRRMAVVGENGDRRVVDIFTGKTLIGLGNSRLFAFSADDRIVAYVVQDEARVERLETGEVLCSVKDQRLRFSHRIAVSSTLLASAASADASPQLTIWSIPQGKLLGEAECAPSMGEQLFEFNSASDRLIATEKLGGEVFMNAVPGRCWELTKIPLAEAPTFLRLHRQHSKVLLSTFGRTGADSRVALFDLNSVSTIHSWPSDDGNLGKTRTFMSMKFPLGPLFGACDVDISPDGKYCAVGSGDGLIHIWELQTGRLAVVHRGHKEFIASVCFSPDGSHLASVDLSGNVKVWDAFGQAAGRSVPILYERFTHPAKVAISDSGRTIIGDRSETKGARAWNVASGALRDLSVHPQFESLSPDGRFIVREVPGGVAIIKTGTGEHFARLTTGDPLGNTDYRFSGDGSSLAIFEGAKGRLEVWDVKSASRLVKLKSPTSYVATPGHNRLSLSLDGRRIAASFLAGDGKRDTVKVWDVPSGNEIFSAIAGRWNITLSPDGRLITHSTADGLLQVKDLASGAGKTFDVASEGVVWAPDQKRLISMSPLYGERQSPTFICDIITGQRILLSAEPLVAAAWSPDGRRLATSGRDARICVRDGESGEPLVTLGTEAEYLRFSEAGDQLLVINPSGFMQALDGRSERQSQPPAKPVSQLSVTRTGVAGLRLAAMLEPQATSDTWNNLIRHCVVRAPFVYALTREGTLWTFPLPKEKVGSEHLLLYPLSTLRSSADGSDIVLIGDTLLVPTASGNGCLQMISLQDPAKPRASGFAGPSPLGRTRGQIVVAGKLLFYFGELRRPPDFRKASGFLMVFDVSDPQKPVLLLKHDNATPFVGGCAWKDRLVLAERGVDPKKDQLVEFEISTTAAPKEHRRTGAPDLGYRLLHIDDEILAVGDTKTRRWNIADDAIIESDPLAIRGRSAVLSRGVLMANGMAWKRAAKSWVEVGHFPAPHHADGFPYGAATDDHFLAVPGDERVWLYVWDDGAFTAPTAR